MRGALRGRAWPLALALTGLTVATAAATQTASASNAPSLHGEWRNMKNSVHIRAYSCGDAVCGTVIWANDKAKADAEKGGTAPLTGTQIFREFRPAGDGAYAGKVFVPNLGRTFSGKLKVTPDNKLVGRGCLIGGLFCKSTTWVRLN